MRAGTENILGIRGFGEAAKFIINATENNFSKVKSLRDYFQEKNKDFKSGNNFFWRKSK